MGGVEKGEQSLSRGLVFARKEGIMVPRTPRCFLMPGLPSRYPVNFFPEEWLGCHYISRVFGSCVPIFVVVNVLVTKSHLTLFDPMNCSLPEGNGTPLQYSCLENPTDGGAWKAKVHGVAKSRIRLSDFTFTFHFHALEKEMATHSSVLAWSIPGTGEPGGLPSMGSHRVRHN